MSYNWTKDRHVDLWFVSILCRFIVSIATMESHSVSIHHLDKFIDKRKNGKYLHSRKWDKSKSSALSLVSESVKGFELVRPNPRTLKSGTLKSSFVDRFQVWCESESLQGIRKRTGLPDWSRRKGIGSFEITNSTVQQYRHGEPHIAH